MTQRRLFVDTRPLRESAAFRRLWLGTALSAVGSQMTTFAVALQVFTLTGSAAAVGAVGLARAVPAVGFGLVAGSIADAVDRRRLVLVTSGCLAAVSAGLAVQAFADLRQVWLLYGLVAVASLLGAVDAPARRTFVPRLLPAGQVPDAAALGLLSFHASMSMGPALAGAITAEWGLRACYLLDAVSFVAALYGVGRLPAMRPQGGTARPGLRAVGEGLVFLRRSPVLAGALLADLNFTVLAMPFALFPAVNADRFGGNPRTLGLLTTAVAVGGLLGAGLSGPAGRVSRQGRAMLVAGCVWGAALAGFGLVRGLWPTLAMLCLAGLGDAVSVVFRAAIVQLATPDGYRGRIGAADFVVGASCPDLGNVRAGVVASLTSPAASAVSGGLSSLAGAALIRLALPAFLRYRAPSDTAPTPSGASGAAAGPGASSQPVGP